jgi:hypothetical protein
MRLFPITTLVVSLLLPVSVSAEDAPKSSKSYETATLSKMMSQTLLFQVPAGFRMLSEILSGANYTQQWVPEGEQGWNWSRMIQASGNKDVAITTDVSPAYFATQLALTFKRSCPGDYSGVDLGPAKVGGYNAHAAIVNCARLFVNGQAKSETLVLIAIRGQRDYFSLQWSERADPLDAPFRADPAMVKEKYDRLLGARICKTAVGANLTTSSCAGE